MSAREAMMSDREGSLTVSSEESSESQRGGNEDQVIVCSRLPRATLFELGLPSCHPCDKYREVMHLPLYKKKPQEQQSRYCCRAKDPIKVTDAVARNCSIGNVKLASKPTTPLLKLAYQIIAD